MASAVFPDLQLDRCEDSEFSAVWSFGFCKPVGLEILRIRI